MDLARAENLAWELMEQWECSGWVFRWFNRKRSFGMVNYRRRVLYLSRPMVAMNPVEEVWDTILHEIAHIKAGPQVGHGDKWKDWAKRVGCRPEACFTNDTVETPAPKWELVCGHCGKSLRRFHRRPHWSLGTRFHAVEGCKPNEVDRASVGKLFFRPIEKPTTVEVPEVRGRKVKVKVKKKRG